MYILSFPSPRSLFLLEPFSVFLCLSLKKKKKHSNQSFFASFVRLVSIEIENTGALKKLDRNQKCLNIVSRKVDLINLLWIDGQEWSFQLQLNIFLNLFSFHWYYLFYFFSFLFLRVTRLFIFCFFLSCLLVFLLFYSIYHFAFLFLFFPFVFPFTFSVCAFPFLFFIVALTLFSALTFQFFLDLFIKFSL